MDRNRKRDLANELIHAVANQFGYPASVLEVYEEWDIFVNEDGKTDSKARAVFVCEVVDTEKIELRKMPVDLDTAITTFVRANSNVPLDGYRRR